MRLNYRNIFFLVGLAALAFMVVNFNMDFSILLEHPLRALRWTGAVMLLWLIIYMLNAASWRCLIRNDHDDRHCPVSYLHILKLSISGFALNYATPLGLMGGEPYRIMELRPYVGTERATSSVILYVMMHILSHICFWLGSLSLFLILRTPPVAWYPPIILVGILLLTAIYFFILGYRNGMTARLIRTLARLPIVGKYLKRFYDRNEQALKNIDNQIAELHRRRRSTFWRSFLLEFTSRTLMAVEVYCILRILMDDVNMLDCVFIIAFTSLFANAFFFSPMQLGAREGGFALAASGLAFTASAGIVVALVCRLRELAWIAIGLLLMKIGNDKT